MSEFNEPLLSVAVPSVSVTPRIRDALVTDALVMLPVSVKLPSESNAEPSVMVALERTRSPIRVAVDKVAVPSVNVRAATDEELETAAEMMDPVVENVPARSDAVPSESVVPTIRFALPMLPFNTLTTPSLNPPSAVMDDEVLMEPDDL